MGSILVWLVMQTKMGLYRLMVLGWVFLEFFLQDAYDGRFHYNHGMEEKAQN